MEIDVIRAGVYVRVSTDEQADKGYSLALQKERAAAQIAAKGWHVLKIYSDGGYSGGNLHRPALTRMLADIEAGALDALVVYRLDRLSRRQKDVMYLIEDIFIKHGISFISVCESLDTGSPTGRAMIGMLSVFAQLERDTITERLSAGRKQKAKEGGYAGGNTPMGYISQRGKKALAIDEGKAEAVRLIFTLNSTGCNLQQIADRLNSGGHTTKQDAKFTPTQIMRILKRRSFYEGMYTYGDTTARGRHPAII